MYIRARDQSAIKLGYTFSRSVALCWRDGGKPMTDGTFQEVSDAGGIYYCVYRDEHKLIHAFIHIMPLEPLRTRTHQEMRYSERELFYKIAHVEASAYAH